MIPMPAKKKSKRTFGKGGKKPTINNPDTHHGTYDLPNASVRSYSEKAKPMKFSKGGEISQEDIDKMSYGEAFKHFRGKGAGTKFTWRGSKQAAYRKGEEPESWKRNEARKKEAEAPKPKAEAPKPKAESKPAASAPARTTKYSYTDKSGKRHDVDFPAGTTPDQADTKFLEMFGGESSGNSGSSGTINRPKFAKGGTVESKSMMKKEIGFMKKKGAPKSMIKHEMAEAKGMKSGGMACGGMKKYARGGGVESHGKTKGTMVKMASGGSVSARADGVASKGKTNCKIC